MPTSLTIGSRSDCDLVLNAPTVSGRHCRLTRDSTGYTLEDLNSTNGTFHNGQRVFGSIRISLGPRDSIHLGSYPLAVDQVLTLLDRAPESASTPTSTISVRTSEMVIGRNRDCDLVIDLPMVSSRHARIYRSGDRFLIEDLGSSNGTYVNGHRIVGPVVVAAGDLIGLGSSTFTLDTGPWQQARPEFRDPMTSSRPATSTSLPAFKEEPVPSIDQGQTDVASTPIQAWRLVALLCQSPVLALLIVGLLGTRSPAALLFWLALAVLWFGLSSILLSGLIDGPCLRAGMTQAGAPFLLSRLAMVAAFCIFQCLLAWGITAGLAGLKAPGLLTLAFLVLSSLVGLALGLLLIALTPRPETAWMILPAIILVLWLFGGIWPALSRLPVISSAVPSRWTFEGLLLLESGENSERDLAQDYFPVDSQRMGLTADIMALSFMLFGLWAAAAFIATSVMPRSEGLPVSTRAGM
jgi:pSer/pThr/pTyr-binding forkhead associated (FHA) protein